MPPPLDPGEAKGHPHNPPNLGVPDLETQEAVLNLISSSFPPLPEDSIDSDNDMDTDPLAEISSKKQINYDQLPKSLPSDSVDVKIPATKNLKRQKRQQDEDPAITKKINTSKQLPDEALKNRYSTNCHGPFEIIIMSSGEVNTSLHPLTVGRLLSSTLKKDILEIRKLGFSKISVLLNAREAANNLITNPILKSKNLIAYIPSYRVSRQGVIKNVPLDLSECNIKEGIDCPLRISSVRRLNRKVIDPSTREASYTPSKSIAITFEGQKIPQHLYLFMVRFPQTSTKPLLHQSSTWPSGPVCAGPEPLNKRRRRSENICPGKHVSISSILENTLTKMAGKRSATTELNHDNWNEENEPEEAGTFAKAADDILEKRVIKTAKRRFSSRDGAMKSAFGTFAGFKTTPATSSSPFGFLANVSTTSTTTTSATSTTTVNTSSRNIATNGSKILENDASKMEDTTKAQTLSSTSSSETTKKETEKTKRYSSDYYAKLKGLNESVATWIKTHVDANPFCILTPIFKDYEKYLKEITSKESTKIQTLHASQHITQAAQNDNQKDKSAEKKLETSSFDTSNVNIKSTSTVATEWKPEKSIFSNIAANTKSIFGNTEQKMESSKSVFSNADATSDKGRSIFGNIESNVASKSIFGNTNVESNPLHKSSTISDGGKTDEENATSNTKSVAPTFPASTFSFGQIVGSPNNLSAGFSFGSAKPFSFAPQTVKPQDSEDKTDNENKDEEDEEPPKPDFKPVTEEGAVYEQRCKVYIKKNDNFSDRGVGTLYLKPTPNGKTQLIVRADTALGNLLLNILLTQSIPIKRMNKNTIMLVCLPMPDSSPPPVPMLLRVKTNEVADELFETLNKHKK